jgi:cysteine synthase
VVCVHPNTDPAKLAAIDGTTTTVVVTPRAINTAKRLAREWSIPNLRPSTNDDALTAYAALADELASEDIGAIVLFATSGATALAVAERIAELGSPIAVHVVQGEGNASIVAPDVEITDDSARGAAAGKLGVRHSRRAERLRAAIDATGGRGWVVNDLGVERGRALLQDHGIDISSESAANAFVAEQLVNDGQRVACIVSGSPPPARSSRAARVIHAKDEWEALEALRTVIAGAS